MLGEGDAEIYKISKNPGLGCQECWKLLKNWNAMLQMLFRHYQIEYFPFQKKN